jgi:putative ABC transport system substrate-binding protein
VALLADPIASGVVTNLARPEANITGFSSASTDMAPKRLAIAREIIPDLRRAGFLGSTRDPNAAEFARQTSAAGALLGVEVTSRFVAGPEGFAAAIADIADTGAQALMVQPLFLDHAGAIVALATPRRLPVFGDQVEFALAGGVVSFGSSINQQTDGAAGYVDRILKGAKPGDLPFQQVDRHFLLINAKAAKAHGLTVPAAVLLQADEVIE